MKEKGKSEVKAGRNLLQEHAAAAAEAAAVVAAAGALMRWLHYWWQLQSAAEHGPGVPR